MKPVQFPTRRTPIRNLWDRIHNSEPLLCAFLFIALFAFIGAGSALASLVDHVIDAWGMR